MRERTPDQDSPTSPTSGLWLGNHWERRGVEHAGSIRRRERFWARSSSVASEVAAWQAERNRTEAKVRWRFTTEDARVKLEKLYPVLEYPAPAEAAKK